MAKLLGIGAVTYIRGMVCKVERITRGGCVVRVQSGRNTNTVFLATLREIANACGK
jgi:hypothetical protein